jgi:putative ABC transport system permease protein
MITLNRLAWKNIVHNLFRSMGIVLAVAAVTGTLFFVTSIMRSVESSLSRNASRLGSDLIVVPRGHRKQFQETLKTGKPVVFAMDRSVLDELKTVSIMHGKLKKEIPVVEDVTEQLFYRTSSSGCCDLIGTMLIGFDPEHDFTVLPWLDVSGVRTITRGEVLVGSSIPHLKGYTMQLFDEKFTVAGKLESTGSRYFDEAVFLTLTDLRKLIQKGDVEEYSGKKPVDEVLSVALVRTTPLFRVRRIARHVERYVKGVQVIISEEVHTSMGRQIFMLLRAVLIVSAALWIIFFLIIAVVFSMIVNERIWEMGVLRAMGANRLVIFRLTITEASILSFAGGCVGILTGGGVLYLFKEIIENSFAIPYQWAEPKQFVFLTFICLALGLVTGIAAALMPAIRTSLMEPATAIASGE